MWPKARGWPSPTSTSPKQRKPPRVTAKRPTAVALDVTKTASIDAAVESVVAHWGGIDILVNNAGIFDMGPIVEVTEQSYEKVFAVNVKGLFFTLQAVARRMIARGQGGKIINMASQAGRRGEGAGVDLLRLEGGGHQPHAIGGPRSHQASHQRQRHCAWRGRHADVGPGRLAVRQIRGISARREEAARRSWPCRSVAWDCQTDYGGAATFLASSDSDYVVSQTLNVDGGNWMS